MGILFLRNPLDLETIALHELGHAHQLFHVNNPPNVLYYLSTAYRRALHEDDLCGGKHIVQISAVDTTQFCQPAMKIVPPEECDITRVISLHKERAEVYAFPNPASDVLFLGIKEREYSSQYSFSLYNGIGQVLLRGELNDGDTPTEISLGGVPRGFLHVVLSRNRIPIATVKLIKL